MEIIRKESLGRQDLRSMIVGEIKTFKLASVQKLESARACATVMRIYGMKFKTKFILAETAIKITRIA